MEAVFCGVSHSLAVCSAGVCYAWGKNNGGQCGETNPQGSDAVSALSASWNIVLVVMPVNTEALLPSEARCRCRVGLVDQTKYGKAGADTAVCGGILLPFLMFSVD